VVFVAGGLTQPIADDYHVYHDYDPVNPEAGTHKVIDLSKTYGRQQHAREKNDEDKRLFYVALTRAQLKLYVPFFPSTSGHAWVGPVGRFLSAALAAAFPQAGHNPALAWLAPDAGPGPGPDDDGDMEQKDVFEIAADQHHPLLPANRNYQSRKIMLESFSSIQARLYHGPGQPPPETAFQAARAKNKEDDERYAVLDSDSIRSVRPDAEIPGGAEIGSMFHDIFEQVDFEAVAKNPDDLLEKEATRDVIVKTMEAYQVDGRWRAQVCRIIANTLLTPINAPAESFVLGRINPKNRIHEVEFYYPLAFPIGAALKIPDCEIVKKQRCFIRGFVDLVFRHNDKFFIADWKSNRLDGGYGPNSLAECMDAAGYHLQYKLYTVALLRWLQHVFGDRFDADRQFGGVFYFFLRGMKPGSANGVYFVSPDELGSLEHLEAEISARVSGPGPEK